MSTTSAQQPASIDPGVQRRMFRGVDGVERTVTAGVVDDDAVGAYSFGQCHALALAVADRTGWPLVGVGPWRCVDGTHDTEICACLVEHVLVRRPDGRLLDIRGAHAEADVAVGYDQAYDVDRELLAEMAFPDADEAFAATFVDYVLSR